ncbi:MAG: glycosyltransferase [Pseudomonadota bacterium]|nr:glycosyl transferase [Pseudomonadales bacterium]MDY6920904.1 glycosyltransferase [Pseudomonadota bacterium]
MKKISLFLPSLRGGGAERVMLTIANALAEKAFQVDLVLVHAEGPYLHQVSAKVNVVDLNCNRVIGALPGLIRYLARARPDAMISTMRHVNLVAITAKLIVHPTMTLLVREANAMPRASNSHLPLKERLLPFMMGFLYRRANRVIAVSQGVAAGLTQRLELPPELIQVVYNPVVDEEIFRLARQPVVHPWLQNKTCPVILAVGRLSPQKDYETLIGAFAKIHRVRPARLIILGEGNRRDELQAMIAELGLKGVVDLPGFQENPFPFLAAADVFVLSSRWEGLPNTLIQALALGTPVVATDCPNGPAEILEYGKWGPLVPVGDSAALADAIHYQLDAECQAEDSPKHQVAERYGVSNILSQYLGAMNASG